MLTPQALERASGAYRNGYRKGYEAGSTGQYVPPPYETGTFSAIDYCEGWKAGANDKKWDIEARRHQPDAPL